MPENFQDSIEQVVTTLLIDGPPAIRSTADMAGVSTRTLQRRLAEVGLTHTGLVSRGRMRLAVKWRTETEKRISEIAYSLGYNDPANFTRAFRQQTGMSPRTYRRAYENW